MTQELTRDQITLVPKDFLTSPIFAARAQEGVREIRIPSPDGTARIWKIGGKNPLLGRETTPLDVSHARVLFALMRFRDPYDETNKVRVSLSELAHTVANSRGGRYMRDLRVKLGELRDIWIELEYDADGVIDPHTRKTRHFTLLGHVDIVTHAPRRRTSGRQPEIWLDYVELHPEFLKLLHDYENLLYIRWDVFKQLTSNLAQALYLYIPSRAKHYAQKSPWKIGLETLLDQVGMNVPKTKSKRKEIFTQNKHSVLSQLDGSELFKGVLRVYLEENSAHTDYNLCCYCDAEASLESRPAPRNTRLKELYLAQGHSEDDYFEKVRTGEKMTDYEIQLLEKAGIPHPAREKGLQICKSLLGDRFTEIAADLKAVTQEANQKTKGSRIRSPGAVIMDMCKKELQSSPVTRKNLPL